MPRERVYIANEGHTLACMIRSLLFANGATFAACIVAHPLHERLEIEIEHPDDCKRCLLDSLRDARVELDQFVNVLKSRQIHREMQSEET